MRSALVRLAPLVASLFVVLAFAGDAQPTALIAGVAAAALATVVILREAARVSGSRELTVGSRAHAHREAMSDLPAPTHPDTAGRPRTRAPARPLLVA